MTLAPLATIEHLRHDREYVYHLISNGVVLYKAAFTPLVWLDTYGHSCVWHGRITVDRAWYITDVAASIHQQELRAGEFEFFEVVE